MAQWYSARLTSERSPVRSPAALNMLRRCAPSVTNSKYRAVTKSKIMEGAKNNRSEQGCDRNYGNC